MLATAVKLMSKKAVKQGQRLLEDGQDHRRKIEIKDALMKAVELEVVWFFWCF